MSGIAGIYNLDGRPVDPALLSRMMSVITHRGPDGSGCWVDGPVGLGHCALHTTPESLYEQQPLVDETGDVCLVLDGRVDNREELKAEFEAIGVALRDDTDAELVLRSYQQWGEQCPAKIVGDFAFVIWDGSNRRLFCARDLFARRPFYYYVSDRVFLFASEMQPLFEYAALRRKPNLPLLGLYILYHYDEREETLYEGIYRLASCHSLTVAGGTVHKKRYWDFDPARSIRYGSDEEYTEHFLSLFREAVRARLRSSGPVGASLSGGLDSSSVVCMAQMLYNEGKVANKGFEAFSVVFDRFSCDERAYSDEVIRKWDVKANHVAYERQDPAWVGVEQARHYPDVLYSPLLFMFAPALTDMRERGIKILLEGMGGDELLAAGFDHLTDLLWQGNIGGLISQLRHDSKIYEIPPASLFVRYCLKPSIPKPVRSAMRPVAKWMRGDGVPDFVNPEFLKSHGVIERMRRGVSVPKFPTRAQQVIYNALFLGWNANVAPDTTELFNARFSVESRHPFLDRRLAEFLIAVPQSQRWSQDRPKVVLRRAMKDILPEKVRGRKQKSEFSGPMDMELKDRQSEELKALFRTSVLASLGVIDAGRLMRLYERYKEGTRHYLTGIVGLMVSLELWSRSALGEPVIARR